MSTLTHTYQMAAAEVIRNVLLGNQPHFLKQKHFLCDLHTIFYMTTPIWTTPIMTIYSRHMLKSCCHSKYDHLHEHTAHHSSVFQFLLACYPLITKQCPIPTLPHRLHLCVSRLTKEGHCFLTFKKKNLNRYPKTLQ